MKENKKDKQEEIKEVNDNKVEVKPTKTAEMQELMNIVKKQADDIELLKTIADKKALAQYYQRNQGSIPLKVKLRVMDGKVIVGWRTLVDVSEYDIVLRRFKEVQTVEIVFEDATKKEMSLVDFNRHFTYAMCEQIGKEETEDGSLILKLKRLDNNKVYKVDVKFVN